MLQFRHRDQGPHDSQSHTLPGVQHRIPGVLLGVNREGPSQRFLRDLPDQGAIRGIDLHGAEALLRLMEADPPVLAMVDLAHAGTGLGHGEVQFAVRVLPGDPGIPVLALVRVFRSLADQADDLSAGCSRYRAHVLLLATDDIPATLAIQDISSLSHYPRRTNASIE